MKCPACKKSVPGTHEYCDYCGAGLSAASPPLAMARRIPLFAKRAIVLGLAFVVCIVVGASAYLLQLAASPASFPTSAPSEPPPPLEAAKSETTQGAAVLSPVPTAAATASFPTPAPRLFTLRVQNDYPNYGSVRAEPTDENGRYLQGTQLTLRALASPGHKFERWEGDAFGDQSRLDIVMDSDKYVKAVFSLLSYAINTDSIPRNGGTVALSPYITEYDYGTRVTLAARPSAGFTFKSWSGDVTGTDATITFVVDGPKNITANFSTVRYTFTSSVNPPGSGTVSPPNATLDKGSNLTVAAALSQGWTFSYWSGDASGTTNPVTVVMDRDKRLVANFTRASYSLSSSAIPATGGSVSPSGGRFSYGETVTLTATSVQDYFFNGWGGDVSGSENPKTITILKDTNVSATFVQRHFSLAVSINPSGAGFVSPTSYGLYAMGSIVILSASPAANYRFVSWTGDVNSQSPLIDVQINRNIAVTANFVLVPPQAQFR